MKYLLFFFFLFPVSLSQPAVAQYYNTGQDPSSLRWMQVKTERFTIIYPEEYAKGGMDFAKSLEESYSTIISLYPERKFRIPVIIHNHSIQSNGYVSWAPKRMELYPTPEQNTIPLDPVKQLAIHELTHVFQMTSLKKGFSAAMSLALGEQFTGIVASLLPLWFLEGQAVFSESAFTESGRGRTPSFQKQLKSITLEKDRMYGYDKILNGSYRDFVPDHYASGYQMVTWAIVKHDPLIWNKVLRFTANEPFTINPVNISLTRNAGLKKKSLYYETFDSLKTIWEKDISDDKTEVYETLNPDKRRNYYSYFSPVFAGDSIIAVKTSLSDPPEFVAIDPARKTEKKIHVPGQMYPYFISCAKGKIVWIESQDDPRWENRKFSVIKILDLSTHKTRRLTRRSRYLSAALSPDGKMVAAVMNTVTNNNSLDLIDSHNGKVISSAPSPGNSYLQRPQWTEDGKKLTVIYLTADGEGIVSYSVADQKWDILIDAAKEDLQASVLRNDSLFFISSASGTDNIFLKLQGRKPLELTRSRFGANDLQLRGSTLLFSDYSSSGNSIAATQLQRNNSGRVEENDSSSFLINRFAASDGISKNPPEPAYKPEPYRKWQHLFKFHSWMPFYADLEKIQADPTTIRPGVTVMSQNLLSTLISTVGYEYSAEKKHVLHTRVTWMGWLPVIESRLDYGNDPMVYHGEQSDITALSSGLKFINTVSVPLHFSSGKFSQYLRPSVSADNRNDLILKDNSQTILSGRLFFSNIYKYALRDIYPEWGQVLDVNYSYAPFDKNIYGSAFTFISTFYFPGFLRDNGIRIRYEKEIQDPSLYSYSNRVSHPRGYDNINSMKLDLITSDYVLPVAYPDFNLSGVLYLKRIRTGLFYDYATGTDNTYFIDTPDGRHILIRNKYKETFKSYGIELLADFHLFRIPYMISAGIQSAWKTMSEKPSLQFLFNIDLYGLSIGRDRRINR